ncbi:MAG TPA: hypothetical protein PKC28_05560, partial [Bdellovibrionales bacterium]|nr:hypothetical protein [Bdellovibrionales bacterium]
LTGFEADAKTLKAAETNLAKARVGVPMSLGKQDFFKAGPLPAALGSRWVFCNPPYGERLKVKEPLADLYAKLFAQIENVAKPDRVCVLLPSKSVKGKFHLPPRWKVLGKRPLLNGGLPVVAFVFGPKSP